jgi:hypothetical protein
MKIKTINKVTTLVALTFAFVAANASNLSNDELIAIANKPRLIGVDGYVSANQALNCIEYAEDGNNKVDYNLLYECLPTISDYNNSLNKKSNESSGFIKLKENKDESLVDSIKQVQTKGESYTSKQYDDYTSMANVMMFANANSQENISLTKQLAQSAQSFSFYTKLNIISPMAFKVLNTIKEQETNQAILTTLLAMSDSLNQIKNDLHRNTFKSAKLTLKKL